MKQLATISAKDAFPDATIPECLKGFKVAFKHPVHKDVLITIGGEMSHWMKKFANAMENSLNPKSKRDLQYNGGKINLKMIQLAWEASRTDINFLRTNKLNDNHFNKNAHSRMRVHLAVQVLSQGALQLN